MKENSFQISNRKILVSVSPINTPSKEAIGPPHEPWTFNLPLCKIQNVGWILHSFECSPHKLEQAIYSEEWDIVHFNTLTGTPIADSNMIAKMCTFHVQDQPIAYLVGVLLINTVLIGSSIFRSLLLLVSRISVRNV